MCAYTEYMRVLAAHGELRAARGVLRRVRHEHGLQPDIVMLTAYLQCLAARRSLRRCVIQIPALLPRPQLRAAADSSRRHQRQRQRQRQHQHQQLHPRVLALHHPRAVQRARGLSQAAGRALKTHAPAQTAGDVEGAWLEFNHMQRRGVTPDVVTYSFMMGLCARRGEVRLQYKRVPGYPPEH